MVVVGGWVVSVLRPAGVAPPPLVVHKLHVTRTVVSLLHLCVPL